jgi:hypothetical protein
MPSVPVAAIFEVLLVPTEGSRVDDEHRVDGWVHQAGLPASEAVTFASSPASRLLQVETAAETAAATNFAPFRAPPDTLIHAQLAASDPFR